MSDSPPSAPTLREDETPARDGVVPKTAQTVRNGSRAADGGDPQIDRSAARLSSATAILAALLALGTVGTASLVAFSLSAIGAVLVVGGIGTRHRGIVTAGATVLFVGVLDAGIAEASALSVLVATGSVLFVWDVGRSAVDVGTQLGATANTTEIELRHAGVSLFVITLTGGVGYAIFQVATAGQPVLAVIALLIAGALLSLALE